MLSSIQSTTNYSQNYKPNFGNLSHGIVDTLIIAAKREGGGYCNLQQVRALAELAEESPLHIGKDLTAGREKAVSAYNSQDRHFAAPIQAMARKNRMNLFEAVKTVLQQMMPNWNLEKKLAEIEARLSKTPTSDAKLEQEIKDLAVYLPDKW